ncbi:MAG TPA: hypothetical protein VFW31_14650 [Candidatus Angelobacter sp.]|nr:hypothetical protein [Candidatus Angelobacter sp.]
MSTPALSTILPDLEDELFYAILDVAQDIDQSLTVQAQGSPIWVDAFREIVRYDILYPAHSKALKYRYIDFRQKGLLALQKQGSIGPGQFRQAIPTEVGSEDGWVIAEVDRARFFKLLTGLKAEQSRRERGQQLAPYVQSNAAARLLQLAESFDRVAVRLKTRRSGREPLLIKDEYDVQYVMGALLETQFEDVRSEDWIANYAGGATRVDFCLKQESTFVETKMMRDGLTDHKLGGELIIDIEHYKQRADCRSLLCFVYDPDHRLKNPRALENDLTKQHGSLAVTILVRPK